MCIGVLVGGELGCWVNLSTEDGFFSLKGRRFPMRVGVLSRRGPVVAKIPLFGFLVENFVDFLTGTLENTVDVLGVDKIVIFKSSLMASPVFENVLMFDVLTVLVTVVEFELRGLGVFSEECIGLAKTFTGLVSGFGFFLIPWDSPTSVIRF